MERDRYQAQTDKDREKKTKLFSILHITAFT